MKWLIACLLALFLVTPAMAGEDPYIAIVGNDIEFNPFYFSPKHQQFMYDQEEFGVPTTFEGFRAQFPIHSPEVCDTSYDELGNANARVTAGNKGWFDWVIRLPKKPSGEINICIQCGVLKPNTAIFGPEAIEFCAAETGEWIGDGFCTRDVRPAGYQPINPNALPTLVAIAFPGLYNSFTPFYLTAYKNPGTYQLPFFSLNSTIRAGGDTQVLDGSPYSRILLKACMDKCVVVKIPTDGQWTAGPSVGLPAYPSLPAGLSIPSSGVTRQETALVQGDLIYVRLIVPNKNTVDIFCNEQSARLQGVGEAP